MGVAGFLYPTMGITGNFLFYLFIFYGIIGRTYSAERTPSKNYLDGIIEHVNNGDASWTAGHNFHHYDLNGLENLLGSLELENEHQHLADLMEAGKHVHYDRYKHTKFCNSHFVAHGDDADAFDSRKAWSYCKSIGRVYNQGECASDWALAPVAAISDRICIYYKGEKQVTLSPHEPISCCKTCGWGCKKGYASMVFKQYVTKGLVTGGEYNSKKGCQPYELKPCAKNFKKCFTGQRAKTPECKKRCYNSEYKEDYKDDHYKGAVSFRLGCACCAMGELKAHGPITGTMVVYEDFLTYKTGIYHHVKGKKLGMLTVKIIGFNDTDPNNRYYVAVNSWGTKWGDKGLFKIRRGVDECMIEGSLRGALVVDDDDDDDQKSKNTKPNLAFAMHARGPSKGVDNAVS